MKQLAHLAGLLLLALPIIILLVIYYKEEGAKAVLLIISGTIAVLGMLFLGVVLNNNLNT